MRDFPSSDQDKLFSNLIAQFVGEWTDTDSTVVTLALDAKGRTAFYQIYHELPPFVACKQCPHQEA